MASPTINYCWSELSTNKLTFTEAEVSTGITYKGPIVSAQLNGVMYSVYQMIDYIQRTGGFYSSNKIYYQNNIVSCLIQPANDTPRLEFFRCKATSEKGISNTPPLINSSYDESQGVPTFQGGIVNGAYWEACNGLEAQDGTYTTARTTFDYSKKIKLFSVPKFADIGGLIKELNSSFTGVIKYKRPAEVEVSKYPEITRVQLQIDIQQNYGDTDDVELIQELVVGIFLEARMPNNEETELKAKQVAIEYLKEPDDPTYRADVLNPATTIIAPADTQERITIFKMRLKGMLVRNSDSSITMLPNRFGITLPEIYYDEVFTEVTNYGKAKTFSDMMPYGVRLEYGWEGNPEDKQWFIYAKVAQGVTYFSLQGIKDFIDVQIEADSSQASTIVGQIPEQENIAIPIRPNGGFNVWQELGNLVIDTRQNAHTDVATMYKRGLFILDYAEEDIEQNNFVRFKYPEYGMYARASNYQKPSNVGYINSGITPPIANGVFIRNRGEERLSGYDIARNPKFKYPTWTPTNTPDTIEYPKLASQWTAENNAYKTAKTAWDKLPATSTNPDAATKYNTDEPVPPGWYPTGDAGGAVKQYTTLKTAWDKLPATSTNASTATKENRKEPQMPTEYTLAENLAFRQCNELEGDAIRELRGRHNSAWVYAWVTKLFQAAGQYVANANPNGSTTRQEAYDFIASNIVPTTNYENRNRNQMYQMFIQVF